MKNMRISKKLILGFSVGVVLAVILGGISVYSALNLDGTYTDLVAFYDERLVVLLQVETNFMDARRAISYIGTFVGEPNAEEIIIQQSAIGETNFVNINAGIDRFITAVQNDKSFDEQAKTTRIDALENIRSLSEDWYNSFVVPCIQAAQTGNEEEYARILGDSDLLAISENMLAAITAMKETVMSTTAEKTAVQQMPRFSLSPYLLHYPPLS
jgi:hypothetical protein